MKRSRFTEEQIIAILKERESGVKTNDICRKHSISEATFYKYKAKFGGTELSDARRLKALEVENAKLKRLLRVSSWKEVGAQVSNAAVLALALGDSAHGGILVWYTRFHLVNCTKSGVKIDEFGAKLT